jgi:hypothetical protein
MKKEEVKMKKASSEMMLTARGYLIPSGGILGMLFGLFLSTVGVFKAVGGTGTIILPFFEFEVDQVAGLVFTTVGVAALAVGLALCYVSFELQRLNVACIILGSCGLIIPSMILGMGYNMAAGIAAIIIGFPWLASLFLWLRG